jgi:hypothetical protein
MIPHRGVAQPGSAPEWGSGGREFESRRPDILKLYGRIQVGGSRVVSLAPPARMSRLRLDNESRRPDCVRDDPVGSYGRVVSVIEACVSLQL